MKYMFKECVQRVIDRKYELIDLWIESNTPAQFWLQQPLKIPDTTASELRAFKIHWFKICHPVLYPFLWILCLVLFVSPGIFLNSLLLAGVGVGLYFIIVLIHFSLHDEIMGTIKWCENGEPMDY